MSIDNIRILTVGLELACNGGSCGGIFSNGNIFNDIPRMSLDCKLVPVQPWEYEYCQLSVGRWTSNVQHSLLLRKYSGLIHLAKDLECESVFQYRSKRPFKEIFVSTALFGCFSWIVMWQIFLASEILTIEPFIREKIRCVLWSLI